jgi:hypothetical protein
MPHFGLTRRSLRPDLTINLIFGLLSGILTLIAIIQAAFMARWMVRRSNQAERATDIEIMSPANPSNSVASAATSPMRDDDAGCGDNDVATLPS